MGELPVNAVPSSAMVLAGRLQSGLSQKQAARLVHLSGYQRWAEYERGTHAMDAARWELFQLLTWQHPTKVVMPKDRFK